MQWMCTKSTSMEECDMYDDVEHKLMTVMKTWNICKKVRDEIGDIKIGEGSPIFEQRRRRNHGIKLKK